MIVYFFVFFLIFFGRSSLTTVPPSTCSDGFTILNDDTCVKLIDTPLLYQDALNYCKTYPVGNLISIHNAIDNRALVNMANKLGYTEPVWLGVTCYDWGYGTNLASGYPALDIGANSYIMNSGKSAGKWISADGTALSLAFFCEIPANNAKFFCPNEHDGYCYAMNINVPYLNATSARDYCQQRCGDLVSIHSEEENEFVFELMRYGGIQTQFRIGASTNGNILYWTDNSMFDYNNFGYFNNDIGSCSSLALFANSVDWRQWISNSCDEKIPFVCKRAKKVQSCGTDGSTDSPNVVPIPTEDPLATPAPMGKTYCWEPHYFTGSHGMIYSPYYPDNYNSLDKSSPCNFLITTPSGTIAQIQFSSDSFIGYSTIKLYSQPADDEPFGNFTGHAPDYAFNSTTNVIRMVFSVYPLNVPPNARFEAYYGIKLF